MRIFTHHPAAPLRRAASLLAAISGVIAPSPAGAATKLALSPSTGHPSVAVRSAAAVLA